jgi:hypothetical protein
MPLGLIDLRESGVCLLSTTNVDLTLATKVTLYTVPAGKTCILSHAIFVVGSNPNSAVVSISQEDIPPPGTHDFIAAYTLSNLTAANDACRLAPVPSATPAREKAYKSGTVIKMTTPNVGGATNTLYLFGTLY